MPALCLRLVWGLQLCLDAAGARAGEGAGEAAERPRKRFLSLLSPPSRSMLDCASKMDRPALAPCMCQTSAQSVCIRLTVGRVTWAWAWVSKHQAVLHWPALM